MNFEDFLKKIDNKLSPERAYKLYMQIKINILEELIIANTNTTREVIERIEQKVINSVLDILKK